MCGTSSWCEGTFPSSLAAAADKQFAAETAVRSARAVRIGMFVTTAAASASDKFPSYRATSRGVESQCRNGENSKIDGASELTPPGGRSIMVSSNNLLEINDVGERRWVGSSGRLLPAVTCVGPWRRRRGGDGGPLSRGACSHSADDLRRKRNRIVCPGRCWCCFDVPCSSLASYTRKERFDGALGSTCDHRILGV
jgi:hypothetical protein